MLPTVTSCGGGNDSVSGSRSDIGIKYARNLKIENVDDEYTLVTLRNPWDTTKVQAKYALVDKSSQAPRNVPADAVMVKVPLDKSVVYSAVHMTLLDELGALDAVSGACDVEYIGDPEIKERIRKGVIQDCGNGMTPNMERIITLRPGAVLLSPYENSNDNAKFAGTGIPVVMTADYMESTPLARAEWMRFYGRLYGKGAEADSLFSVVEANYNRVKERNSKIKDKPSVMFDMIYSNIWNVPTSGSVTGHFIEDAGGVNPFAGYNKAGSVQLSPEEVLFKARNADIWLIRYFNADSLSLNWLAKENPIYSKFKAWKDGKVYVSDTAKTNIFVDGSFHPDRILSEMTEIIHPSEKSDSLKYYRKLK